DLAEHIRTDLAAEGWPDAVLCMSGNGAYLLYRIELPNEAWATDLVKRAVQGLADRYDTDAAEIDRKTYNASRIIKVMGTWARKGSDLTGQSGVDDRPHRKACYEPPSGPLNPVPRDLLEGVAVPGDQPKRGVPTQQDTPPAIVGNKASAFERCRHYVLKCPPAESGNNGHGATFRVACETFRFGLSDDEAMRVMQEFNATRTVGESWTDHDLRHKLEDAKKDVESKGEFGCKNRPANDGPTVDPHAEEPVPEAPDDPDRLACVNRDLYRLHEGREIRYWQGEWYTWNGLHYERQEPYDMRGKIREAVKKEFKRLCVEETERYYERAKNGEVEEGEKPPERRKVKDVLITNVMSATASMTRLSGKQELNSWIENPDGRSSNIISMANGLFNVDAVIPGGDEKREKGDPPDVHKRKSEPHLLPHTANWFSMAHLPYNFDPKATCPKWMKFLETSMEDDHDLINVLQEWAGCLLFRDTDAQKMMILVGEGANGKSVFCATMEAMLGPDNCSHVQFEDMAEKFHQMATLGKLVNICADVSDHEVIREGVIKSFCAGDRMTFDRKFRDPVHAVPTARLMLACNNLPRIKDKTDAMTRRMLIIPWNRVVPENERIVGMDKAAYWQRSGELPGIFRWAVLGLARYRRQGKKFSPCQAMDEALGDYRRRNNPALVFIESHLQAIEKEPDPGPGKPKGPAVKSDYLIDWYSSWCKRNNYKPLNRGGFWTVLKKKFPNAEAERRREGGGVRTWVVAGIDYQEGVVDDMNRDDAYTNLGGEF
ncbi:MAG: DNA primase family protein, partial [Planctomycetota bacterium]